MIYLSIRRAELPYDLHLFAAVLDHFPRVLAIRFECLYSALGNYTIP